jgi:pre-mRNA-processing factor SLU7
MSYCAGEAGIQATEASSASNLLRADAARQEAEASSSAAAAKETDTNANSKSWLARGGKRVGEGDVALDQEKLQAALRDERKRRARPDGEGDDDGRDKRRKYNAFTSGQDVTEEEMEAYRMTKVSAEDPMANYRDDDD